MMLFYILTCIDGVEIGDEIFFAIENLVCSQTPPYYTLQNMKSLLKLYWEIYKRTPIMISLTWIIITEKY